MSSLARQVDNGKLSTDIPKPVDIPKPSDPEILRKTKVVNMKYNRIKQNSDSRRFLLSPVLRSPTKIVILQFSRLAVPNALLDLPV